MTNTRVRVERSPSKRHWIHDFEVALGSGCFREAADIFERNSNKREPVRVVLLAAHARLYSEPPRALQLLLRVRPTAARESVEHATLLAEAFAYTRDFQSADAHLKRSLVIATKSGNHDLLAVAGFYHIRRFLIEGLPAKAREFLDLARSGRSEASAINGLYAECLILLSEERVSEQAALLIQLLRSLPRKLTGFHELRANSTRSLAALARELYIPEAIPEVERQLETLPWSHDFAQHAFQALEAVGWAKVLQGDYFSGFRHLKRASVLADSAAWRVIAASDRSYLARRFGEHRWSRVELDEAEQLAKSVDWHATLGEERVGLLLIAELFSDIDAGRAAIYLARYREISDVGTSLYWRDSRLPAFVQLSTGVVEIALGNKKLGLSELRKARATFERFGFDFRVARCLVEEYRTTGNSDLLPIAAERLRNYGQSWLAAELRTLREQPGGVSLPRMQKLVFDEVCKGKTTAEIAEALGRSEFTISNHIKEIFKAFGVNNRASLLAEAGRQGLLNAK